MWDALRVDVRHSLRGLRRSPGFTLAVILTVALAIGATTTIGSLLNAIVLRRVSATDPDRLVSISTADIRTNQAGPLYPDTFVAYRAAQPSFSEMSMYWSGLLRVEARSGTADGVFEGVSPEYFDLLGARAAAGRFLASVDDRSDGGVAARLSWSGRCVLPGAVPSAPCTQHSSTQHSSTQHPAPSTQHQCSHQRSAVIPA